MSKRNKKVNVYLWLNDVKIIPMTPDVSATVERNPLENICTLLQAAACGNDVDALCELVAEAAIFSQEAGDSKFEMQQRIYHRIMAESVFNKTEE